MKRTFERAFRKTEEFNSDTNSIHFLLLDLADLVTRLFQVILLNVFHFQGKKHSTTYAVYRHGSAVYETLGI